MFVCSRAARAVAAATALLASRTATEGEGRDEEWVVREVKMRNGVKVAAPRFLRYRQ